MSCSNGGQVQTECCAGEISERAREVVETLGLADDGGNCNGGLEAIGEGDGGDQGGEEGGNNICTLPYCRYCTP